MSYDEKGRLITSKVTPMSIIGKKMKQTREVLGVLNLMYNNGSDPQLIQEQLNVIDNNIPTENKKIITTPNKTEKDKTNVARP